MCIITPLYHCVCTCMYRPSDELFQQLEDNQVALANMKASRFVKAFEQDVDHWERTLSHILEVIEMILQVQRQWMYLEVRPSSTSYPPPFSSDYDHYIVQCSLVTIHRISSLVMTFAGSYQLNQQSLKLSTATGRYHGHLYTMLYPTLHHTLTYPCKSCDVM